VLIVTDRFDVNMLTESCDVEFKAIDLATAKQLLKVVPYCVEWQDERKDLRLCLHIEIALDITVKSAFLENPPQLHYDTTVMVVMGDYEKGVMVNFRIWLITPIKFT
jgi:hypothetical protein